MSGTRRLALGAERLGARPRAEAARWWTGVSGAAPALARPGSAPSCWRSSLSRPRRTLPISPW
eukprot:1035829-Alexandrium_andersonii.AAC.1